MMDTNKIVFFKNKIVPQRLREAREFLELTMSDLASKVEISRQAVSLFESGERVPDPSTMIKIAQILGQPLKYFTNDRPAPLGIRDTIFFRDFKSKTRKTNKRCEIIADWFTQTFSHLGNYINLPTLSICEVPPPSLGDNYSIEEIEKIANTCRRFWGLNDEPIGNLINLMESKGFIIGRFELGTQKVNGYSFWEGSRPFVFLSSDKDSACRSRFDLAHELGHLLLHRGISEIELENNLDKFEKEANKFANAFLLPAKTFASEIFSTRLSSFLELKKRWKVSIAAQVYRCQDLNILDEHQILNLRKQLSNNGWRKNEPLDDFISPEKPSILQKSLKLIIENQIETPFSLISDVGLSEDILNMLAGEKIFVTMNKDLPSKPNLKICN